jgi:ribonuclease HI
MGIGVAVWGKTTSGDYILIPELEQYRMAGASGTSNIAEYCALTLALELALELRTKYPEAQFEIFGDSQLIINQVLGVWRCKSEHLKEFYEEAQHLRNRLGKSLLAIDWYPRKHNTEADRLSKLGITEYLSTL